MYEHPVKIAQHMCADLSKSIDNDIIAAIQMHIDVDKEELIKALRYDREQYEKGFEDGRCDAIDDVLEIIGATSPTLEYEVRCILKPHLKEFEVIE